MQLPAHGLERTLTLPQSGFLQSDDAFNPIDEPDMIEHEQGRDYNEPELRQVQPARRGKSCPEMLQAATDQT